MDATFKPNKFAQKTSAENIPRNNVKKRSKHAKN